MSAIRAPILGCLIASLAAALVLFVAGELPLVIAPSWMQDSQRYHVEFFLFTLFLGYAGAIVLGGPTLLVLMKLRWTRLPPMMISGTLVGVLAALATTMLEVPPTDAITPEESQRQLAAARRRAAAPTRASRRSGALGRPLWGAGS